MDVNLHSGSLHDELSLGTTIMDSFDRANPWE